MTPTYAVKKGVRYRYYISTPLLHGKSEIAGTVARVPAPDVEDTNAKALQDRLKITEPEDGRTVLQTNVERVEIHANRLVIALKLEAITPRGTAKDGKGKSAGTIIHIPGPSRPRNEGATLCCQQEFRATKPGPSKPRVAQSLSHLSPKAAGGSTNLSAVKPKPPRTLRSASVAASAKSI